MLEVSNIAVEIGSTSILRGLGLNVPGGSIVGLVGRNGAGKTTTLRTIMGLVPLSGGDIHLGGQSIAPLPAHERTRLGIGYLPEDRRLIAALTVEDNLMLPAQAVRLEYAQEKLETIYGLLPEVRKTASFRALNLSGGQQKLVALGRSFVTGTRLLLLDEPFEGVSTALSRRLAEAIRTYQEKVPDLAVLVAESDLKRAAMLTDRAYVIERGEVIEETLIGKVEL